MVPQWFTPTISREEATNKLENKYTGCFLIRQSSQPGTLALSVRTGRGKDDIQHFIILSRAGAVALEDSELEFDSLVALVNHYSTTREELPVCLKIMEPSRKSSAPAGFQRSDSPYVSMVGKQRTKSTIWVNSPVFRTTPELTKSRDLEVIQSVLQQGSSIQDTFSSLLNDCLSSTDELTRIYVPLDTKQEQEQEQEQSKKEHQQSLELRGNRSSSPRDRLDEKSINGEDEILNGDERRDENEDEDEDEDDQGCFEEEDYSVPVDLETNLYQDPDNLESTKLYSTNSTPSINKLSSTERTKQSKPVPEISPGSNPEISPGSNPEISRPIRFRKNNSVVVNQYKTQNHQMANNNLSKSCSNIFEELEKRNENKQYRKSFVRKVSINLSVRRNSNNIQPIRKLSAVMKKMFPVPKVFSSLVNSQENSDSWEYLPECGMSPVYEEVKDVQKQGNRFPVRNSSKDISVGDSSISKDSSVRDISISKDSSVRDSSISKDSSVRDSSISKDSSVRDSSLPSPKEDSVRNSGQSFEDILAGNNKLSFRSGSCDSLYESEYSISNPTSIDRNINNNNHPVQYGREQLNNPGNNGGGCTRDEEPVQRHRKQSIPAYLYERKHSKLSTTVLQDRTLGTAVQHDVTVQHDMRKPALAAIKDRNVTRICISSSEQRPSPTVVHYI